MERIAWIMGDTVIGWNALILVLASGAAACLFLALYLNRSENMLAAFTAVPLAAALSLAFSRLVHWYCASELYESFWQAMTDYTSGSYALVGVFAGCLLAAVLLRLTKLSRNLPQMLDCMVLAGSAGIGVGRLAALFTTADRGQMAESFRSLPWVYPMVNVTSGVTEYRFATFLIQAMVAGVLFVALAAYYLTGKRRGLKDGDTTLIFLLFYGASQILLDSTRYDSLYFRSNGFVSVVQVLSLVVMVAAMVIFSARMVRTRGFRRWYLALWGGILALTSCAGYMEYYVQRHGNQALFAYSVMGVSLLLVAVLTLIIRYEAEHALGALMKKLKKADTENLA